jgi:hypothetical protein
LAHRSRSHDGIELGCRDYKRVIVSTGKISARDFPISSDGGVPVIAHAYPRDRPDVTQFPAIVDELVARYRDLVEHVESLTVVSDAGQNSGDNHALVEAHGIGFVGSLPPSDHPDLLGIPARDFRPVDPDRYPGLPSY